MQSGSAKGISLPSIYGFTLVELLVVLSIIALLLTIATPRYFNNLERAKEATLKEDLFVIRDSIDKFYGDHNQFPDSLEELVEKKYIRKIPVDPITEKFDTWILIEAEPPNIGIEDIKSGAEGKSIDGSLYEDW
jgi:general secretion pathway protein G